MTKRAPYERKHLKPTRRPMAGRSFPVSGESQKDDPPRAQKMMEGGYGMVKSTRPKESAIVKKSRAQLIQRLGILPRK